MATSSRNRYNHDSRQIEDPEWIRLHSLIEQDPDNFENWENLIRATEAIDEGLGRSSRPEVIYQARQIFDAFLAKFPLLFGYWKRYADIEFAVAGSDAAELVYQRGVAGIPNSVDLWSSYCSFKMETCPDEDEVRELFNTAADLVGLDFLSHTFWDKYVEFEERMERPDLVFAVHSRIARIPMHQYARYFEKYTTLGSSQPVEALLPEEELAKITDSIHSDFGGSKTGAEFEQEMRARIHQVHIEIFNETQKETMSRWPFEAEIKRSYFHVTPVEEKELINWRKYLDFEEIEGDLSRTRFLYEKCLVATALYDEFWFRYVRWMTTLGEEHYEEVRNIFRRGSSLFVPIGRPAFRIGYAHFEEAYGDSEVALSILDGVLEEMPDNVETIIARANLERRVYGLENAVQYYQSVIKTSSLSVYVKGALVAEWAKLIYTLTGSANEAREIFRSNEDNYLDSRYFWINYLRFEIGLPTNQELEPERYNDISHVINCVRSKARLPPLIVRDLTHIYLVYLLERGGPNAMREYNRIEGEVFGPFSIQRDHKMKISPDGTEEGANRLLKEVNGQAPGPSEEALKVALDIPTAESE
ncbi:uncharacterized protein V2V93DRAFT_369855 [Kockiozyma suomiensis]|uniref:uncharacterized protein n=1 Tax=Kockiozyma suomiensis TaxID=1337062 RepID=UPI00334320CF